MASPLLGAIAGCTAKSMVAPLSRTVIQMQLHHLHHTGSMLDTMRGIYQEGGIRAFWRGNGATLLYRGVVNGVNFPVNELCKRYLKEQPQEARNFVSAFAGSFAGICIGHPVDVIKTRISASQRFGYSGILETIGRLHAEEGLMAFYAGFRVSMVTVVPNVACCFYLKDTLKSFPLVKALSSRSDGWLSESAIAGGTAGGITSTLFFPFDSWKRRLQMPRFEAKAATAVVDLHLHYRGLLPELIKVSCNTAIMFGLYDWLSQR